MKIPSNILAIVDPTATSQPAVEKAAVLAAAFNARLELFVCDVESSSACDESKRGVASSHSKAVFGTQRKQMLEQLAQPLRNRGLDVATDCCWGNPLHEGLLQKISYCNPDLVVKDTHHHALAQRTIVTNTDWQLLRGCPPALLLVKPKAWERRPQVLACVDPGHHADAPATLDHEILLWSKAMARALEGDLHALHVYFPQAYAMTRLMGGFTALAAEPTQEMLELERKQQLEKLQALAAAHAVDVQHLHLVVGAPFETIPDQAQRLNADVLAMGAISRSALKRIFIGNTAERVLDRLPCDVLVIKPLDFAKVLPF